MASSYISLKAHLEFEGQSFLFMVPIIMSSQLFLLGSSTDLQKWSFGSFFLNSFCSSLDIVGRLWK